MFRADDAGEVDFKPGEASFAYWDPPNAHPDKRELARYNCHPTIAFELIERELRTSPPSLWTIQMYATHAPVPGKPSPSDPLAQRSPEKTVPLLQVLFSRRTRHEETRFLVQHMDQCGELKTPTEAVEQIKTAVARWMVEGVV